MILAIEASTSAAKAYLYTLEGIRVSGASRNYTSRVGSPSRQTVEEIFIETMALAKEVLIQGGTPRLSAIAMSSVWSSLLLTDHDNKPIEKLRTWADMSLSEGFSGQSWHEETRITGCPKHLKYPRWKLSRLKEAHGEDWHRLKIGSLPDYLYYRLTGSWVLTKLSASGSGLLDLRAGTWSNPILEDLDLETWQLPELVDNTYHEVLAKAGQEMLGISYEIPVGFPNPDGALNQFFSFGHTKNRMSFSVGTSGALRRSVGNEAILELDGLWQHGYLEGNLLVGATISGAGSEINRFMTAQTKSIEALTEGLGRIDNHHAPFYLPFTYGEQSPGWHPHRTSGFYGLTQKHGEGDCFYSILEGIGMNLYQGYRALIKNYGPVDKVSLSGGIVKNPFWCQLMVNLFNLPIELSYEEHASLAGAVKLYLGQGWLGDESPEIKLEPRREDHDRLMARYQAYIEYYKYESV